MGSKTFNTLTFKTDDSANAFMEKNSDYGVIGTKGEIVHVAKNSDKGE